MKKTFTIQRDGKDQKYTVDCDKSDTYLDVLDKIKQKDATLVYRKNCQSGICGTCGCTVNGKATLACITKADNKAIIGPRKGRVIRDLVVDEKRYFDEIKQVKPFIINNDENTHRMFPGVVKRVDHAQDCVLCGCCDSNSSNAPVSATSIVKAWQYFTDSREHKKEEHLAAIHDALQELTKKDIEDMSFCPIHIDVASKAQQLKKLLD